MSKIKTPRDPEAFPGRFLGQELRRSYDPENGAPWFSARDVGRALGYGSDGGNLSRNFAHVNAWREMFDEARDYRRDERGAIWLSTHGVLQTLRLVAAVEREDRAELADRMLRRWADNSRRRARAA